MQNKHKRTLWNTLIHPRDQFHGNIEWLQELTMTKFCKENFAHEMLFNFSKTLYNVVVVTERCSLKKDVPKYRSYKVW